MANEPPRKLLFLALRFFARGKHHIGLILLTILVMAAFSAANRGQAFLLKPMLDNMEKLKDLKTDDRPKEDRREIRSEIRHQITRYALYAVAFSLVMFVFGYLKDTFTNFLSNHIVLDLRNEVTAHIIKMPLRFFYNRKTGDLISRVTNDINTAQMAVSFLYDDLFMQPLMALTAVGLICYANWQLGLIAAVLFPLYAIPIQRIGRKMRVTRRKSLESLGEMTESMMQMTSGVKIVKAFGMEEQELREFRLQNEAFFRKLMSSIRKKALGENLVQIFAAFGILVLAFAVGSLLASDRMKISDMALFVIGVMLLNAPIRVLTRSFNLLQESMAACERIFEILDMPTEQPDSTGAQGIERVEKIEYQDVWFSYDTEPVLREINFLARPGEIIAIVGPSGAGKSTLLDLLCRFYDPQQGSIRINGTDLRKIRRRALLDHIAVVTQETFLFNTTVRDNIRYGCPTAHEEAIYHAAKAANIHDFVMTLERGYDSVVGERGAKLSGGERQRIAIARAILKRPSILLLDEATSSLDTENERMVQEALNRLIETEHAKGITFVIAHRLSTVRNADRILVLEKSRIIESGQHDGLLSKGGLYAQLYERQFAD